MLHRLAMFFTDDTPEPLKLPYPKSITHHDNPHLLQLLHLALLLVSLATKSVSVGSILVCQAPSETLQVVLPLCADYILSNKRCSQSTMLGSGSI